MKAPRAEITTATSAETWTVRVPCGGVLSDGPCSFRELDHYGQPGTGLVWCSAHGGVAGVIRYRETGPS